MDSLLKTALIVCPFVFLAGFVDSVAGGGGLISLPAYLLAGLPAHLASGTNKLANGVGSLIAAVKYARSGKIVLRPALTAGVCAILGAVIGTSLAARMPEAVLRTVMLAVLPCIALFLVLRRDFGQSEAPASAAPEKASALLRAAAIGLVIGCYDGLIGPGTGTFMLLAFTALLSMDLLTASGCAKLANLASTLASAVVWIGNGQVWWALALPAALCSILGNWFGARYAIRGGSKKIRGMLLLVLALLFCKMLYDLIF